MLLSNFRTLNNWFYENVLIFNPKKCHFMSGKDAHDEGVFIRITLPSKIDRKFIFLQHTKKMCRKAGQKFCALMRLSIPSYEENKNNIHYQGQISV